MKTLFFFSLAGITLLLGSCNKKNDEPLNDKISIKGTWNETYIKWVDNEGNVTHKESLDTTKLIKLSIGNSVIQQMYIDTSYSFYFLMYSTYKINDGILTQSPDSLLDIEMNMHYVNHTDSIFDTFPVVAYPFESSIEQFDNKAFVEKRRMGELGGLDIEYRRINDECIDLKDEFENYAINRKSAKIINKNDLQFDYSLQIIQAYTN